MEVAQKSLELQTQIRQNSETVKNTLNDLFNWEKEIKDKEKKIIDQPEDNKEKENMQCFRVRSHITELDSKQLPANTNAPTSLTPTNSVDKNLQANSIKVRGNKCVKFGEYTRAIEFYTQAIELNDSDAVYYNNRALCYLKLERYDECIADCDRAIEIDQLAVKAYYRRMMAYESLGNNKAALKDCTSVLLIEPKNGEAKRSLERIKERVENCAQATKGPNFSVLHPNFVDILPIDKPAHERSSKPLSRLAIEDGVFPSENITISDEDIDKLFNSSSSEEFEEITITEKEELAAEIIPCNDLDSKRPLPPTPNSTAQFYSNWKELTPTQKYFYLRSIPLKQLCKILGAGFDSDTLTDIINTVHDFYLPTQNTNTAETLLEVSKNKQISILSLLLSNKERTILTDILKSLEETNYVDAVTAVQISKNFNLNYFDIQV